METDVQNSSHPVADERPELLIFCGILGLLGPIIAVVTAGYAATIAEHDFIADTISDLGRGPHRDIMDTGFYICAAGLLALAFAASHVHLGHWDWSLGIICLGLLALNIVLIGIWHQFGDGVEGMSVHTQLTFGLGPLYLAGPVTMMRGAHRSGALYPWLFGVAAALWIVLATWFKLAPNNYDGIVEKAATVATLLWTVPLSWIFLKRGWQAQF